MNKSNDKSNSLILKKIIDLRQKVLYPLGSVDKVIYSKDTDIETVHFLFYKDSPDIHQFRFFDNQEAQILDFKNQIIATGSLLAEDESEIKSETHLRIRGMAVHKDYQGQGLGQKIVKSMIDFAQSQKSSDLIWCNARVEALSLYQRFGFITKSEEFVIPGSGPHRRLHLKL